MRKASPACLPEAPCNERLPEIVDVGLDVCNGGVRRWRLRAAKRVEGKLPREHAYFAVSRR
eukprot:6208981-Pleurochrysis_carterae.AAC.1